MKFIEEKLEKAFTELLGQEGFRRIANAFGSTFTFFAETQTNAKKCKRATKPTHQRHRKQWTIEQRQTERQQVTAVWQKWRFSAPQTVLWLIKHLFSASTFVVKIATFAKPPTVNGNFKCGLSQRSKII